MSLVDTAAEAIKLDPKPGFVVKSRVVDAKDLSTHPYSTKVFINVCRDDNVPKPSRDFEPEVVFPLIIDNQWEIPIILSTEKKGTDKKGQLSFIYDCCINTSCFQWCQLNSDLRQILIEWCLEAVELMYDLVLERNYSIPKMLSKGDLSQTVVLKDDIGESGFQKTLEDLKKNETAGLVQEINAQRGMQDIVDVEDSENALPDLMNIRELKQTPTPKAPLIQEINDMNISESASSKPKFEEKNANSTSREERECLTYNIVFKPLQRTYNLLVRICFNQNISALRLALSYNLRSHDLILSNNDPKFCFNVKKSISEDQLVIPLPKNIDVKESEVQSYYERSTNTLFVFC